MREISAILAALAITASAQSTDASMIDVGAALTVNASTGQFAPYMIGSWTNGRTTQQSGVLLDAYAIKALDKSQRWSYGYGVEFVGGATTKNDYDYWSVAEGRFIQRTEGPAPVWVQQFYGELKYRGVFLTVGQKDTRSALLNNQLSSGDLVESNNARPILQARVGFIDFQDIPFTQGWVQIQGEISYGKLMDNDYLKSHYNYYSYHINLGGFYTYKRCYFRTRPAERLSMTIGMQVGGMFGGQTSTYTHGRRISQVRYSSSLQTVFKMFLPMGENGEDYYTGSSLGCWDLHLRYRLRDGARVIAYVQKPWEDGSGIGLRTKLDGLWGLEYQAPAEGWLDGMVVEYLDFRDQGGPLHWSPGDFNGTTITSQATGRDNYYNNNYFNSYAYYGMSIGTPFLLSPLYNLDGFPGYVANRAQGVHVALTGAITPTLRYRLMGSYQRALGTYNVPFYRQRTCTSMMAEAVWSADALIPGLRIKGQMAFDAGSLRGNNFGACLSVSYHCRLAE